MTSTTRLCKFCGNNTPTAAPHCVWCNDNPNAKRGRSLGLGRRGRGEGASRSFFAALLLWLIPFFLLVAVGAILLSPVASDAGAWLLGSFLGILVCVGLALVLSRDPRKK